MRWLSLVAVLALVACEPRVIVSRTPAPQGGGASPTASGAASPSPTPERYAGKGRAPAAAEHHAGVAPPQLRARWRHRPALSGFSSPTTDA